jgi:hypothetical protein
MKTMELSRPHEQGQRTGTGGATISAVILQARRRRRRRLGATIIALLAVLASAAGVLAATVGGGTTRTSGGGFGPGPGPGGVSATVLMYPVHAPASAPQGTGLAAYVGDLGTGQLSQRKIPGIINCNCGQPLVDAVGGWLVYINDQDTVSAVTASLAGRPRILGDTSMFAPAASPAHVWLEYQTNGPTMVRLVPVAGGPAGSPVSLPMNTSLVEGTTSGLLLQDNNTDVLELWSQGRAPVRVPGSAGAAVLASTPTIVVFGTRCQNVAPPSNVPAAAVGACALLHAFNVAAGSLRDFPAPARTVGWFEGSGGVTPTAVSPDGALIAAMDLTSATSGAERLFVVSLAGSRAKLRSVPAASGSQLAWSSDSRWLFYQGPGHHLWAYAAATSQTRHSTMPCCNYWAMTAVPSAR